MPFKKGDIFTAEHKANLSAAKKGKPSPKRGVLMSEEQKKKISKTNKRLGIKPKIRDNFKSGVEHPFWKGGITPLVEVIRHSFEYRQWRSDVFFRDLFTCQICGKKGGDLNVDHYPKLFSKIFQEYNIKTAEDARRCEEFWNINNGRTLCVSCHQKFGIKK